MRFARYPMARFPVLPVIAPGTRFQPVYVRDLARAIATAALDPKTHAGRTYEIAGPEAMTLRELNARVADMAGQSPDLIEVPDVVAAGLSCLGFLPGAPLTRDQWKMLQVDNVPAVGAAGLEAFGITPTPFHDDGSLDHESLRRLTRFTRDKDVDGMTILGVLGEVACKLPLVFALHPRTRAKIGQFGLDQLVAHPRIIVLPPQGYLEMLGLMSGATAVLTDSGGMQEETTALRVPFLTLP